LSNYFDLLLLLAVVFVEQYCIENEFNKSTNYVKILDIIKLNASHDCASKCRRHQANHDRIRNSCNKYCVTNAEVPGEHHLSQQWKTGTNKD